MWVYSHHKIMVRSRSLGYKAFVSVWGVKGMRGNEGVAHGFHFILLCCHLSPIIPFLAAQFSFPHLYFPDSLSPSHPVSLPHSSSLIFSAVSSSAFFFFPPSSPSFATLSLSFFSIFILFSGMGKECRQPMCPVSGETRPW